MKKIAPSEIEPHNLGCIDSSYKEQNWLEKSSDLFGNTPRTVRKSGCSGTSGNAIHSSNSFITPALRGFPEWNVVDYTARLWFSDLCNSISQERRLSCIGFLIQCLILSKPLSIFDVLPEGKPLISKKWVLQSFLWPRDLCSRREPSRMDCCQVP